jgi:hypothetical protein
MIKHLINPNTIICEIGVFKGDFSKELYSLLNPSKLVLIDIFEGITGSGDKNGNNFEYTNLNQSYNHLKSFFSEKNVDVLKGDSVNTLANNFDDNFFDMVYIDADHSYEGTMRDLNICYKKVKSGGWIMGHDFDINTNKTNNRYEFGVKKAVIDFCNKYNLYIYAKGMDGCVSFAINIKKSCHVNNP